MPIFKSSIPLGFGMDGNVVAEVRLDDRAPQQRGVKQVFISVTIDERCPLLAYHCTTITAALDRLGCDPPNGSYWSTFNGATGSVASATLEALRQAWFAKDWTSKYQER